MCHPSPEIQVVSVQRHHKEEGTCSEGVCLACPEIQVVSASELRKGRECASFRLDIPHGRSALASYPVLLHEHLKPPWSLNFTDGCLYIRASLNMSRICDECTMLPGNATLANIVCRMEDGVHKNTQWIYHGAGGLLELLRRKDEQRQNIVLLHLNQVRHLVHVEGVLSAHKNILRVIASKKLPNIDQALHVTMRQGMSVHTILQVIANISSGKYKPKGFTSNDRHVALVLLHLGGKRALEFAHLALRLPATSTVRALAAAPPLRASLSVPTIDEVVHNVNAVFKPLLRGHVDVRRPVHATIGVDEIVTEQRLWWDDTTNCVLGLCRKHTGVRGRGIDTYEDVEVLVEEVKRKVVHHASEASVFAVTPLSSDARLSSTQPITLSGTCKTERAPEQRKLLQMVLSRVAAAEALQDIHVVCYATDGASTRGKALHKMTTKHRLGPEFAIYPYLKDLEYLDLWVGDDDLTIDKDFKHVAFKHICNCILWAEGMNIFGTLVTSEIFCSHLRDEAASLDLKEATLSALFNVADKQDVNLAYRLAFLLWDLRRLPLGSGRDTSYIEQCKAINLFADLWFNLMTPYISISLSLSEQLVRLSTVAHIVLTLYCHDSARTCFIPNPLYINIMLMIKNTFFCVAKAQVDNPGSNWFLISMGTDGLESIFGVVQTMVGNDANADVLQLAQHLSHSVEVTNIIAEHPEWDQSPRHLHITALGPDMKPADDVDHINAASWHGDTCINRVHLRACWSKGRFAAEDVSPLVQRALTLLPSNATILAPFGGTGLLFTTRADAELEDDAEEALDNVDGSAASAAQDADLGTGADAEDPGFYYNATRDFEDRLQAKVTGSSASQFSHTIEVGDVTMNKSCALAIVFKFSSSPNSTDRLHRIQGEARYMSHGNDNGSLASLQPAHSSSTAFCINHPITMLLECEGSLFVAIAEVIRLKVHSKHAEVISISLLGEPQAVQVTYQLLHLIPVLEDTNSPNPRWQAAGLLSGLARTTPGSLILPIDPELIATSDGGHAFVFLPDQLLSLAMALNERIALAHASCDDVPKLPPDPQYPYWNTLGAWSIT
ncbi:hypothetical protein K488DRAFT_61333 [Vararia minispora EC-137]|uniref:Uncharacterized protein n=1 Tax=Vararia minispora EC-137 TaxID=1314806 RepID=A0ACB8Q6T7_9AGAM|nr:hypothetical protein K488DRAFT_61333 [Vararia minispora EC-137]